MRLASSGRSFPILGQTTADDSLYIRRSRWIQVAYRRGLLADNLIERIDRVFAFKRLMTGDCFIKNAAERKNVGTMIDLVDSSLRLFRRHIANRAENCTRCGVLPNYRGCDFAV